MEKAEEYYKEFVTSTNIVSEFSIPAEHSMVSLSCNAILCSEIHYAIIQHAIESDVKNCRLRMITAMLVISVALHSSTTATSPLPLTYSSTFIPT